MMVDARKLSSHNSLYNPLNISSLLRLTFYVISSSSKNNGRRGGGEKMTNSSSSSSSTRTSTATATMVGDETRDARRKEGTHGRIANSQEFLDSMRLRLRLRCGGLSLARFVCRSVGSSGGCAAEGWGTGSKRISNFMYPRAEGGGGRPPAVTPMPIAVRRRTEPRRAGRQWSPDVGNSVSSRRPPLPPAPRDPRSMSSAKEAGAIIPIPAPAPTMRWWCIPGGPTTGGAATRLRKPPCRSTVVVGERARGGGVVEVSDLRRVVLLVVVVRGAAHGGEGRVGVDGRAVAVARREEGDGPRGEEVLGVGVGAGPRGVASPRTSTASASTSASASAAEPLHALERRYFWRWDATFSRVRPSTLISCIMVLGTAFLMPRCATASTKRLCSCGVHTRRGRLSVRAGSSPAPPPPAPPLEPAADDAPPPPPLPLMSGIPPPAPPAPPAPAPPPCVAMSKATARSGVMSVCVSGMSSSGRGSWCSSPPPPRANQLGSSSSLMSSSALPPLLGASRAILAARSLDSTPGRRRRRRRLDSTPAGGASEERRERREGLLRGGSLFF
ncbi:LOW QUALITY PROTEIN: hypothetical protein SORBI_3009G137401 [Sorghum bicolor]|uniref:Uncharacterized protein n=1 Tax=Sorghum bicolor TaxID=4558 RepID=A0A1Z5R2P3_SORBI|nr:LOW QUALITY PROTEIN: hypothetical protein SORBI_3009G137401 [Sorghum bicolor]